MKILVSFVYLLNFFSHYILEFLFKEIVTLIFIITANQKSLVRLLDNPLVIYCLYNNNNNNNHKKITEKNSLFFCFRKSQSPTSEIKKKKKKKHKRK